MAPARRVMSHEYGSTQFDIKVQMSWFLPGSTSSSPNLTLASIDHRHRFRVNRHTCYSAFQKGKEKEKRKREKLKKQLQNCV